MVHTLEKAVGTINERVRDRRTCAGDAWVEGGGLRNLHGNRSQLRQYCGLPGTLMTYPEWSEVRSLLWTRIPAAFIIALLLQWSTTGASMVIAYNTPVKGLGCRSGSYLIYGGLATVTFFFLVCSMFLSHAGMLRLQKQTLSTPAADGDGDQDQGQHSLRRSCSSLWCKLLGISAVILRVAGKLLAIVNAVWLLLSTFFELVGFYESCTCNGMPWWLKEKAWVLLFKTDVDLQMQARGAWMGGIALAITLPIIMLISCLLWSREFLYS